MFEKINISVEYLQHFIHSLSTVQKFVNWFCVCDVNYDILSEDKCFSRSIPYYTVWAALYNGNLLLYWVASIELLFEDLKTPQNTLVIVYGIRLVTPLDFIVQFLTVYLCFINKTVRSWPPLAVWETLEDHLMLTLVPFLFCFVLEDFWRNCFRRPYSLLDCQIVNVLFEAVFV